MERRKDTVEIAGPHRREKEVLLQSCRGVYEVSLGAAQTFSISECTNLPKGQQRVLLQTPENRFDFLFFFECILLFYFICIFIYLFYFWLCWVFIAACGLSCVVAHGISSCGSQAQ